MGRRSRALSRDGSRLSQGPLKPRAKRRILKKRRNLGRTTWLTALIIDRVRNGLMKSSLLILASVALLANAGIAQAKGHGMSVPPTGLITPPIESSIPPPVNPGALSSPAEFQHAAREFGGARPTQSSNDQQSIQRWRASRGARVVHLRSQRGASFARQSGLCAGAEPRNLGVRFSQPVRRGGQASAIGIALGLSRAAL